MNPDLKDPLLRELLSNDELEDLRASTLDRGLALVRRRRARRDAVRAMSWSASLLCATALVCWILLPREPQTRIMRDVQSSQIPVTEILSSAPTEPGTDIAAAHQLTDDELLGLFPGRPVALIGSPGSQKLVFLDQLR